MNEQKRMIVKIPLSEQEWKEFDEYVKANALLKGAFIAVLIRKHLHEQKQETK